MMLGNLSDEKSKAMLKRIREDLKLVRERDPAARGTIEILICYPGFQAITMHRVSHRMWRSRMPLKLPARILSQVSRALTGIEIHPGASIGEGVFIDHGMGVVIGETAKIGNKCLLYQGVTLGGTGKQTGKRHPTLEDNVVVGAGAKILGAITIGANTRIGAGSVVVKDVKSNCTVVGIPGRVIQRQGTRVDPLEHSELPDAEARVIKNLMERIDALENKLETALRESNKNKTDNSSDRIESGESQNLKDKEIIEYIGDA